MVIGVKILQETSNSLGVLKAVSDVNYRTKYDKKRSQEDILFKRNYKDLLKDQI